MVHFVMSITLIYLKYRKNVKTWVKVHNFRLDKISNKTIFNIKQNNIAISNAYYTALYYRLMYGFD